MEPTNLKIIMFVAFVCLVGGGFSGCFSASDMDDGFVSQPKTGSEYYFLGDDGSELVARVDGVESRYDAYMRPHESLILNYTFTPAELRYPMVGGDDRFYFEEAIDLVENKIVQQVALCGIRAAFDSEFRCLRSASVLFGSMGLPGGLGLSPFWGEELTVGSHFVESHHRADSFSHLELIVEHRDVASQNCRQIGLNAPHRHDYFRGLPWTVITGPVIACPGYSFPVEFKTEIPLGDTKEEYRTERVRFRLIDHVDSGEQVQRPDSTESGWGMNESISPLHRWSKPYPIDAPEPDWHFSLKEAHHAGMEQSERYRSMFESETDPVFVRTSYSLNSGSSSPLIGSERIFEQRFVIAHPQGDRYEFRFEKTIREGSPFLGDSADVTLEEENNLGKGSTRPTVDTYATEMISPRDAYRIAWDLSKPDVPADQKYTYISSIYNLPWGTGWWGNPPGAPPERIDGLELVIRFPGESYGNANFPHESRFDGPTGSIIHMARYHNDLPFGP